jgi:hypothetical protein
MESGMGFQERKGVLRFEVSIGSARVEAFLSKATCRAAHMQVPEAGNLTDYYRQYQARLDAMVLDMVNAGARHPVVLMARDLQPHPADQTALLDQTSTTSPMAQEDHRADCTRL